MTADCQARKVAATAHRRLAGGRGCAVAVVFAYFRFYHLEREGRVFERILIGENAHAHTLQVTSKFKPNDTSIHHIHKFSNKRLWNNNRIFSTIIIVLDTQVVF